jgi:hypothetical protein
MPKNLTKVDGKRVRDVLNILHGQGADCENALDGINGDACCNERQAKLLAVTISNLGNSDIDRAHELRNIIILANTFRLECRDCLNAKCPKRDPNYPVRDIHRRSK